MGSFDGSDVSDAEAVIGCSIWMLIGLFVGLVLLCGLVYLATWLWGWL